MNCIIFYHARQHTFFFLTQSDSLSYAYGCYRSANEIVTNPYLVITQAYRTTLDNYTDDPDFLFLGNYFISDGYNHNIKETLLLDYPELFI